MNFATYRTAIEAWVLAQTGLVAQWRDAAGGWQGLPQVRLHIHTSKAVGVGALAWNRDDDLPAGADLAPTVMGDREFTLSVLVRTRDQSPATTAMHYLEKLRTSLRKPSVHVAFYAAGLAYSTAEAVIDLEGWNDDRLESVGSLDVHFNAVENEEDALEVSSNVEAARTQGALAVTVVNPPLLNASFTAWTDDLPDHWTCTVTVGDVDDYVSETTGLHLLGAASPVYTRVQQAVALTVGARYSLEILVSALTGTLRVYDSEGNLDQSITSAQLLRIQFTAIAATCTLRLQTVGVVDGTIDRAFFRAVPGAVFEDEVD